MQSCLVLSTLIFNKSILTTDSDRKINHLHVAEELDSEEVLKLWIFNPNHPWLNNWNNTHKLSPLANAQFKLLIELFNRLPRCLEFMEEGIRDDSAKLKLSSARDEVIGVNNEYFQSLIDYVFNEFGMMYKKNTFPDSNLLMALLQREEVNYEKSHQIQDHLRDSTLVNNLDPPGSQLIPVASIVPLYSGALKKSYSDVIAGELVDIVDGIKKKITNFHNAGDLLEYLGSQWIKFKCLVLRENKRSLSILDFFMISKVNKRISGAIFVHLQDLMISIPRELRDFKIVEHEDLTISTWDGNLGKDAFFEKLKNLKVDAFTPLQLHQFHKREAFDLLMIVYDNIGKKPILFFIDYKSKDDLPKGKQMNELSKRNPTKSLRLPGNGKQYNHMKDDVLCYFKNRIEKKDVVESSVLQSFTNGDYYYIYFTIHYEEDIESFHQDKAIVLTRCDTTRFFSFVFPLYRTLRGFMNKDIDEE